MRRALALLLLSGCFPYRELYRPELRGWVIDADGAPVGGTEVRTCSYSQWREPSALECPRSAMVVTDADGGFAFSPLKEWAWCCLGEAPLPLTEVFVCSADGGANLLISWRRSPGDLVLQLGDAGPRCAEP